ncbi:MAG: NAD(P)H-dependent oxidoreductase, partial [Bacteroidetes bacterium]
MNGSKKYVVAISGSASSNGANQKLLQAISLTFAHTYQIDIVDGLSEFPLFSPQRQKMGIPDVVADLKLKLAKTDSIIISTPEYLHNIPAVLKNMLEWITESGELANKNVLAITFAPHDPRGKHAMTSLLQSLKAVKANVVAELPL